MHPKRPTAGEAANLALQLAFNALVLYFWGRQSAGLFADQLADRDGFTSGRGALHLGALCVP